MPVEYMCLKIYPTKYTAYFIFIAMPDLPIAEIAPVAIF